MDIQDYMKQGLEGEAPLKLILRGHIDRTAGEPVGVVAVVYATEDKALAEQKMKELTAAGEATGDFYMVYSVPLDTDLAALAHYPSVAITKSDLE